MFYKDIASFAQIFQNRPENVLLTLKMEKLFYFWKAVSKRTNGNPAINEINFSC